MLGSYLVEMVVEILGVNAVIQGESPVREQEFVVRTWESVTQGIRQRQRREMGTREGNLN